MINWVISYVVIVMMLMTNATDLFSAGFSVILIKTIHIRISHLQENRLRSINPLRHSLYVLPFESLFSAIDRKSKL